MMRFCAAHSAVAPCWPKAIYRAPSTVEEFEMEDRITKLYGKAQTYDAIAVSVLALRPAVRSQKVRAEATLDVDRLKLGFGKLYPIVERKEHCI